jgi:acyl-coenzyme A synthetase/AMP-(fatty) acid ligase
MAFEYLVKEATDIDFSLRDPEPEAYCVIDVGSGSTGKQKFIPYTHQQLLELATRTARQYSLSAGDRLATLVHLNFVSTKRRYLSMISAGAATVLFSRSRVDPVALVKRCEVSILIGTVFHLERLLSSLPDDAKNLMSGLRLLVVTSSTVSTALRNRIAEKLTRNLCINYGANECSTMTWAQAPEVFEIEGTVGTPMEGVSVEIIDADGKQLPPGEVGQIRLQAPGMVDGYLNDAEASGKSFSDAWFYPGDLGKFTEVGQLIYCGRADHMMIMNGINIYPAEIERVVSGHPAIRDTAAVPIKHTVHQDVPVCAVSLHAGTSVTQQEMLEYTRQRLGARGPRFIVILEEIPRDERGKLRRPELYQQLTRSLKGAGAADAPPENDPGSHN